MQDKYLKILIDGEQLDIDEAGDSPVTISYKLEDPDNFQVKTSADALDIVVPATLNNDKLLNTFHNASLEDLTSGNIFNKFRKCTVEESGYEILVGKCLLTSATHTEKPEEYKLNIYGNNGDWIIALKDTTLYDFLKDISFDYTTGNLTASWAFDGMSINLPYVFAPVRYMLPFDNVAFDSKDTAEQKLNHYNTDPSYLCPALSIYWIIFKAFKSVGYKIQSTFCDTSYFRKLVMPWTFGAFPSSNGTKQDVHKFVAASYNADDATKNNYFYFDGDNDGYVDLNPVVAANVAGTYDNNDYANGTPDFSYDQPNKEMKWTYQASENFGIQNVTLSLELYYHGWCNDGNDFTIDVDWIYVDAATSTRTNLPRTHVDGADSGGAVGRMTDVYGPKTVYCTHLVNPGDSIIAKVHITMRDISKTGGVVRIHDFKVNSFTFEYFKTPLDQGAQINFEDYTFFKQYKFPDFLKGILDCFNLSIQANPVDKIITLEPTHDYSLLHDQSSKSGGYIKNDFFDWTFKQDLSQKSELQLFSDGNRELVFRFRDDGADGCLKVVTDRIQNSYQYKQDKIQNKNNLWAVTKSMLAAGKYVLPDRFAKDITEVENSFFSPCMHYQETNWRNITGIAPQLICIIPENVSNTSASEASNTFQPKIAWYKGNVSGVGGWRFNGVNYSTLPFMFSVNYNPGGENDPILSYCDEAIRPASGSTPVIGVGLLRRFFLQRMAIMRNGKYYTTFIKLQNIDVANLLHREYVVIRGQRWELVEIEDYRPSSDESTKCNLRKWAPVSIDDYDALYPTASSISGTPNTTNIFETKYNPLMCLNSDIPQQ